MSNACPNPLPCRDEKPVGAADFYFAINATFRFIEQKLGIEALRQYWKEMGRSYYAPVGETWKRGLPGVAAYWKAFYEAEPGAEMDVRLSQQEVVLNVEICPAIRHLREHRREIVPCFCQHCYFVSEAMGEAAGIEVRVEGGNGSCQQRFFPKSEDATQQDLSAIREAR